VFELIALLFNYCVESSDYSHLAIATWSDI